MNRQRGKILVIRGGAIGDFILTLPVLAALREQFPQTHLEVLGYPHIAKLALTGGLVDGVQSIEARALASFFASDGQLDEQLAYYFGGFALILSYLYDPDEIFKVNVARCSAAQFIQCPHRPDESLKLHATEVLLKPLERLAIFGADSVPRLNLSDVCESTLTDERWLALHPGSGSEIKNWPEDKWEELLNHLVNQTDLKLLLVGGEAEGDRLARLSRALPQARIKLAQYLPLSELALVLKPCIGFVGHDSGISHLAAALGLPALVLWGETEEAVWSPKGERIAIVRSARGLAGISVAQVMQQLVDMIAADPDL